MPKPAMFPGGRVLLKSKVVSTVSVRKLPRGKRNILCNNHGEDCDRLAEFGVFTTTPGIGNFETFLCDPCAEKILEKERA